MGSVYEEITRLETAKADIETAIEGCGVNVPDTDLISTYALYIRQIPSAVFSELNVDPVGGEDMYIKSIELKDGLINATVGGLVSSTSSGIVPKTGTKAAATINNQGNDWVLTTTSGGEPSWRRLPANAFKNDNTNTTYSLAGALNGNTFITTLTDSNSNKTAATIPCVTGASTSAAGKAGLVPAPAKNKLNQYLCSDGSWYDLNVKRYYSIDASELDTTKFYPVIIASNDIETDCEVHSPNVSGTYPYNQNVIHFILNALGWTDTPKGFKMIHQGVYSTDEITIGAVGAGNENGSHCVWVRGGLVYRFYCNKEPKLKEEGYTSDNEVYSVGANYSGGTNSKVTIYWTYGDSSQLLAVKGDIPTKTSQLTNNSGFLTSRGYIGGTLVQASQSVQNLVGIKNIIGENSKEVIHATDGYLEFGKGFSDVITWFNASLYKFKLGNTQAFIITTDGKVGIGDVGGAPKAKLHVAGGSVLADSYHAWSGGFSKEGCSDAHILLAGGGHTAVSNFATVSGVSDSLKSYVTLSTNLTITGSKTFTASTNTFSGTGASILTVDRNSTNPAWIRFCKNGTLQGYIGITNDFQPVFLSGEAGSSSKTLLHAGNSSVSKSGQTLTVKINGVELSLTNTTYSSLKNPNAIKFKNTSGTTITYDGSSAADLTGGVNYAASAGSVAWGNITGKPSSFTPSAHDHTRILFIDDRNVVETPTDVADKNGIEIHFKYKSKSSVPSTGTWTAVVMLGGYSDTSGGYPMELGFSMSDLSESRPLYLRSPKSATEWGSWRMILDSNTYKDFINTTNFPGLNSTGDITGVTAGAGLSGGGTSGSVTLTNAGVRSTTINGNYLRVNTNGTNADLTIPYATNADTVDSYHIWVGNSSSLPATKVNNTIYIVI